MKRHLLFFALLLTITLQAQETTVKHELFVSYGIAPTSIPEPDLPMNSTVNAPYSTNNKKFSGTINVGYLFHVSDPLAIGITYSYSTAKRNIVLGSSIPLAEIKNTYHAVMLTGKYSWLRLKQFSFYSRIGVGLISIDKGKIDHLIESSDSSYLSPSNMEKGRSIAWQVMPAGVEWNFVKHLALFAEGGVGSAGCGMAGVKILF